MKTVWGRGGIDHSKSNDSSKGKSKINVTLCFKKNFDENITGSDSKLAND